MNMRTLPEEKDYREFIELFTERLFQHYPDVCFYTFGSIDNGSCDYGRSDIDGGLILDSGPITDKDKVLEIGRIFAQINSKRFLETQFNLLDRQTCRDGRFLSYTADFTDFIKESGTIRSGHNLLEDMHGLDFKSGVLYSAAFNFCGPGSVRNALLYLFYNIQREPWFCQGVQKTLEKVAKFPKKLVWLQEGEIVPSRHAAQKRLEILLPESDFETLGRLNALLGKPGELHCILQNQESTIGLLRDALSCLESMVNQYLKKFPTHTEREFKK